MILYGYTFVLSDLKSMIVAIVAKVINHLKEK